MNINIEDHLSKDEIKQIVIDEFRSNIRKHFKEESDMQRILTNTAYMTIYKELNELTDNKAEEIIKNKLNDLLEQPLHFGSVFRPKDVWDKEESKAYKILNQVVEEKKPLLAKKVHESIHNLPKKDVQSTIKDALLKKIAKLLD